MRHLPTLSVVCLLFVHAAPPAENDWTPLLNGKDLAGWETWLDKPERGWDVPNVKRDADGEYLEPIGKGRDPLNVFTIVEVDGKPALRVSGQGFGVITTKQSYANYHLKLQFKWGEQRWPPRAEAVRDSGLLYHVHSEPGAVFGTWPRSVEFQIQEHDTGDLWTIGTRITGKASRPTKPDGQPGPLTYDLKGQPTRFVEGPQTVHRCVKGNDAEKPRGEWNTLELICFNGESIHIVNGQVVMRLTNAERLDGAEPAPLRSGPIALQTEGAEVFYREVEIREIEAMPDNFAAP